VKAPNAIQGSSGSSIHEAEESEPLRGHPTAIYEISSILHPAHGACISDEQRDNESMSASASDPSPSGNRAVFAEACDILDISVDVAREL
jgi:hypothetical protein